MGRDKCLFEIGGVPLWRRQCDLLQAVAPDVWIVAPTRPAWCDGSMKWAADAAANCGPLAGVAAGLERMDGAALLVLAVDLPEMTADYLGSLARAATESCGVVPEMDGLFQPLSAVYPRAALPVVRALLGQPDKSLQRLLRELIAGGLMRALPVAEEARAFFRNLNAPSD